MSPVSLFSPDTVERLGWMLVHFLWQAAVVALLLAVLLRLLRRAGANVRYLVSCLALLLMVILPTVTIALIDVAGPVAEPGPVPTASSPAPLLSVQIPQVSQDLSGFAEAPASMSAPDLATAASWQARVAAALEPALPYVVFAWLAGVFGLCAWHLGGWAQLQRFKRRGVRDVDQTLQGELGSLSARLGVHRAVALLESALVEVPTVVGWLRPVILLPACALTGLSPEQLEAILAHELAHIRRYDYLVNLLQTVVEILGFYHPAVWWVSQRMRIERENCCDGLAVRLCGDSVRYARALTCMEEIRHRRAELALAATGGSLVNRIARLLGRPAVDDRRCTWLPGVVALLLVTILLVPTAFVVGATSPRQTGKSPASVAADAHNASNLPATEQSNDTAVQVRTDVGSEEASSTEEKISVSVEFTVTKVLDDEPMDHETTVAALSILGEPAPATGSDQTLTMTACEVLRKYVAARELPAARVQSLIDLLRSRGYIKIEASPQVLARDGVEAKIQIGEKRAIPSPARDTNSAQATTFEYVECGTAIQVTPHVQDPNVITLEMAVELTDILPNPSREQTPLIRRRTSKSALTMSTNRCFSQLIEQWAGKAGEPQNEEPVLIIVKPSILRRDAESSATQAALPAFGETGTANTRASGLLDILAQIAERTGTKIEFDGTVKPVPISTPPDWAKMPSAETALLTALRNTPYTYQAKGPDVYLVFKPITGSFAGDLRTALMDLGILAEVPIISDPNVAGEVHADIRAYPLEKALEIVLAGTPYIVKRTPHYYLVADRNVQVLVDPDLGETRTIRLNFITPERAKSLLPVSMQQYVDADPGGPNNYGGILRVTAPPAVADRVVESLRRLDRRPRQVRLDVRIVAVEPDGLRNLDITWSQVLPAKAGRTGDAAPGDDKDVAFGSPSYARIGYTAGPRFTDSVLAALDLLHNGGQADILSSQQMLAQEDRDSRLKIVTEEWVSRPASMPSPPRAELCKVETGTALTFTPHVGDHNDITLDMSTEISDRVPRGQGGYELPVVTRRTVQNAVTIPDGGTVVVAGWVKNDAGRQGKPAREIAVFVTAHLADNDPDANLPMPKSAETVIRIPPAADASGWERPHQILLDFMLAGICESLRLDRETALQAFDLITPAGPATLTPMSLDELCTATVGRILYTVGERIPAERFDALVKLLKSKGFISLMAAPRMLVDNGKAGQMHAGKMALDTRAEILEQGKTVLMDVKFAWDPNEAPTAAPDRRKDASNPRPSARNIATTNKVMVPNNRYAILFLNGSTPDDGHADETYCLMVKPSIIDPP